MFGSRLEVKRFEGDVLKYEARPVETGKILFYGSSIFTRTSFIYCDRHPEKGHPLLEEELLNEDGTKAALNHGFGTSSADDLLYYYDRLVRPYEPRALVLATGGNDFAFGYSADEIMNITATLIDWFQADFPGAPVFLLGRWPQLRHRGIVDSGSRFREEMIDVMRHYCEEKEGCHYISMVDAPFYYADPADIGNPDLVREDIYDTDNAHFNAKGYELLINFFREILKKEGLF